MKALRHIWILITLMLIPCSALCWPAPTARSQSEVPPQRAGQGVYSGSDRESGYMSFQETDLGSAQIPGGGFHNPAAAGPAGSSSQGSLQSGDMENRSNNFIDEGLSSPGQGRGKVNPLLEQRNPYYTGRSARNVLTDLFDKVLRAPEGLFGKVYNMVDDKVFPAAPATSGANDQDAPPEHDTPKDPAPSKPRGFGGGGISPFMQNTPMN